jgi:hypothetical protein
LQEGKKVKPNSKIHLEHRENKLETSHIKNGQKMPVVLCRCGAKILIVPDLAAMKKAIKNHLNQHNKVLKKCLTEENLTEEMLTEMSQFVSKF